jgi:hypothetical protein
MYWIALAVLMVLAGALVVAALVMSGRMSAAEETRECED